MKDRVNPVLVHPSALRRDVCTFPAPPYNLVPAARESDAVPPGSLRLSASCSPRMCFDLKRPMPGLLAASFARAEFVSPVNLPRA